MLILKYITVAIVYQLAEAFELCVGDEVMAVQGFSCYHEFN